MFALPQRRWRAPDEAPRSFGEDAAAAPELRHLVQAIRFGSAWPGSMSFALPGLSGSGERLSIRRVDLEVERDGERVLRFHSTMSGSLVDLTMTDGVGMVRSSHPV